MAMHALRRDLLAHASGLKAYVKAVEEMSDEELQEAWQVPPPRATDPQTPLGPPSRKKPFTKEI